jgi:histidyl-tRNA synthetase
MKPSLPQGTRDFDSLTVRKRQYILQTITSVFEIYGYQPLETPAMENLTTLTGKYGEEGDRLIFKILNNGLNEPTKHEKSRAALENILSGKSDMQLTERALRYDLTIPFARYVAMNRNDIALPFKRYQTQAVWRADRPQKGRYREFWQCDADVVGTKSLLMEAELLTIYHQVFAQLKIPVAIKLNNRKILAALAESIGKESQLTTITIAIDKLDKIGWEGVSKELLQKDIDQASIASIKNYLDISGNTDEKLNAIAALLGQTVQGQLGLEELKTTLAYLNKVDANAVVALDFTLARGLDYYTGMICEIVPTTVSIGSIGGGGRYDNLTGVFDYPDVSGVGISFGVDRIYDVLETLGLFPEQLQTGIEYFFINFAAEMYPDAAKFDKQIKYANKRNFPFVCILGEDELATENITVKNFTSGEQSIKKQTDFISEIK